MTLLRELRSIEDRPNLAREARFHTGDIEMRAGEAGGGYTFEGIASVVGVPYTVRDAFGEFQETMQPRAFNKTLKEKADVRFLVNHDGLPVARTKSGTLKLSVDPSLRALAPGLDPANPLVQQMKSTIDRGDADQMSIGMRVVRQEWNADYTDRQILEAELFDVSLVTYPASPTTSAAMRSIDDLIASLTEVDMDEADIRRAIAFFEARIQQAPVDFSARDRDDLARLSLLCADLPALLLR